MQNMYQQKVKQQGTNNKSKTTSDKQQGTVRAPG
jgi:hypothetical protein